MTTRETHSNKALKTLAEMSTTPENWKQADIEWEWKLVQTFSQYARCQAENCRGGYIYEKKADGTWTSEKCKACNGRGSAPGYYPKMTLVGKVLWPQGVRFDSRFAAQDRTCCELCSKSLQSLQCPVVGTGADGRIHGMWVGTDCAKKFLPGVSKVKAPKSMTTNTAEFILESK